MPERRSARAPAKVNLALEVLGRREDGYHAIATLVQTLELSDSVTLTFGGEAGVSVGGHYAEGTPADETNLAWRAAALLAESTGRSVSDLQIELVKRIPAAGGLGGGSSDAATVLRLLWGLWPEVTPEMAAEAGARVGSDVPALATGGTALAQGRGEVVSAQAELPQHGVVLFVPRGSIEEKTARMFESISALAFDDGSVTASLAARLPCQVRGTDVFNAFERVAFGMFPGLAELWTGLESRIGDVVHLSGAGPTLFWIGPLEEAETVAASAEGMPCAVILTATAASLWRK